MSERGEKNCPLCTEEMDLTDQQLKPCTCGYEICVWCWHHVMEMAEKDGTEGRCPACRTAYDKEKIVATAANCERMVAEINSERKQKSQKAKPKSSEGRTHLTNIRVIQRNLVYIIGLPLNLADEELLQRREYFGKYGKVLKVSISRTATGVIQHSANNSCCVYITYSKEEEAIRCIQSVHSFVLEDRTLRACFGTTKYCHAWLRNMPCSIPDCLYLHDFGSEEDSFTKDEIVSAFTRSKVQQVIGATNNLHRRSGNVLPPPADEYISGNISSTAKPNNTSNIIETQVKGSCADSGTGKSNALPAPSSWVMRVSASLPPNANSSGSCRSPIDMSKTFNDPKVLKSEVVSTTRSSHDVKLMEAEASCEVHLNSKLDSLELMKEYTDDDCQTAMSNINADSILDSTPDIIKSQNHLLCFPSLKGSGRDITTLPTCSSSLEYTNTYSPGSGEDESYLAERDFQGVCSVLSSIGLQSRLKKDHSIPAVPDSSVADHISVNLPGSLGSQEDNREKFSATETTLASREAPTMEDLRDFDDQQLKGLEGFCRPPSTSSTCSLQNLNQSNYLSWQPGSVGNQGNLDTHPRIVPVQRGEVAFPSTYRNSISNGFSNNKASSSFVNLDTTFDNKARVFSEMGLGTYTQECNNSTSPLHNTVASEMGESSIISKILSIDSDAWEDSLTSPHSLVKLLSEDDNQHGSLRIPSLLKESDSRQSRFSFARHENFSNHVSDLEHSFANIRNAVNNCSSPNDLMRNKDLCMDKYQNIFSTSSFVESDNFPSNHSFMTSSVSKAQTLGPPGFAVPSRAPPPGFSTHGIMHKPFDGSASHLLQTSSSAARNGSRYGDVEFVDPADRNGSRYGEVKFVDSVARNGSRYGDFEFIDPVARNGSRYGEVEYMDPAARNGSRYGDVEFMDPAARNGSRYGDVEFIDPAARNGSRYGDVELVDPAVLEVGKGIQATWLNNRSSDMRQTSSPQLNAFDHDARLQLLMRQSISEYQNPSYPSHLTNRFSPPNDTYSISSMLRDQPQLNNPSTFVQSPSQQFRNSHMSSGHLGNWNDKSISDLGVSDLMTNGGLGYNNFIPSYEDLKFQMSNSSNVYSRGFAM